MQVSKNIPDLPAGDYRFMAIIHIDGYGRPRQLEAEFRRTLERILESEFGRTAHLTTLMKAAGE